MQDKLFKKYYNRELGISFFYNSTLSFDDNNKEQDTNLGLFLRHKEFQFKILKLSPEANIGLRYFGLENGLKTSLNANEIVIEDLSSNQVKIEGCKIVQTTTIVPTNEGNIKIKRYLLSQDGQGYLLVFQNRADLFDSDEAQDMMTNIIETIKLLDR